VGVELPAGIKISKRIQIKIVFIARKIAVFWFNWKLVG
jgi:hypothetical protein